METSNIADLIDLPRVKLVEENKSSYRAKCGDHVYYIRKGEISQFVSADAPVNSTLRAQCKFEQIISLQPEISLDDSVPHFVREVVIFHEIREKQYAEQGVDNPHQHALHDELLYIFRYFDAETQEAYIRFAREHRTERKPQSKGILDIEKFYKSWKEKVSMYCGDIVARKVATELLGNHERNPADLEKLKKCLNQENIAYFLEGKGIYCSALVCAVINNIPEVHGKVTFNLPEGCDRSVLIKTRHSPDLSRNLEMYYLFREEIKNHLKRKNVTLSANRNLQVDL